MSSKKILTIIYLNRSIALSRVSFSGKTANVSNYSEFALPDGTIENSIVYDPRTVSGIVKEYINAVGLKQIDKSVACIPDNKVKIIFYKYDFSLSESQNEDELTNLVESEMNIPMPQLSVITDTFNLGGETMTVVYAIRKDILDPYITSSRFGASIFPASLVMAQALSKNLIEPSVVIYPRGSSLRFFVVYEGHVVANDVDDKNILDIDNNLSNGIREIIEYGETLTGQPIKKVLFIEGKKISKDDIRIFMQEETGFEVEFFRTKDATLDQYKFLALKGLIKKVNDTGLERPSIKKRIGTEKQMSSKPIQVKEPNNLKIAILSTVILALVLGLVVALAWNYYNSNQRKPGDSNDNSQNNANVTDTVKPTSTPVAQIVFTTAPVATLTATPVPTTAVIVSNAVPGNTKVQVLNGTESAGLASKAKGVLESMGFPTVKAGNLPPYNTQVTTVNYNPGFENMADMIVEKFKGQYALIKKVAANPTNQGYDVIMILGLK